MNERVVCPAFLRRIIGSGLAEYCSLTQLSPYSKIKDRNAAIVSIRWEEIQWAIVH